jgi:pimeloyl-ACP methyl ester carboxylesterase
MITFILPGYSPKNKVWADEAVQNLKLGGKVEPIYWSHWENESKKFDDKQNANLIIRLAKEDRINLVAKSVGTLVATLIVKKIPERVNKIILCGIPTVSDKRLKISREAFKDFPPENIIVFQNQNDPFATYVEVEDYMRKVNPKIKVISKERSDHHYPYYQEFQEFILSGIPTK